MNDLSNIKAGDRVIVNTSAGKTIKTVKRITPTGLIVIEWGLNTLTFYRDGHERGGDIWHDKWIQPCPPDGEAKLSAEIAEREVRSKLLIKVNTQVWRHLSTDQLQRIVAILDETTQPTKDEARTLGAKVR